MTTRPRCGPRCCSPQASDCCTITGPRRVRRWVRASWTSCSVNSSGRLQAGLGVEIQQQMMCGDLAILVPPLGGPVHARDESRAVHPAQVTVDEGVARLGAVRSALGEPEMPLRVVLPGMRLQIGVLRVRVGLYVAPVAVEHVLTVVD